MASFANRLRQEFEARRDKNARYSLRAFAALLGVDHATLSQILRGTRRVPVANIKAWAPRLGLDTEETRVYIAAAHAPDDAALAQGRQLRDWSAEASALVTERTHFEILRLLRLPGFNPDSRWIARQAGVPVDRVNIALDRLLRLGLVAMRRGEPWRDLTGLPELSEASFRRVALAHLRRAALAEDIGLPE